jgi:selenocysteine-specific elongation factor
LRLLSSADAPLRAWTPVHIHLGAAHHLAHVVPLSADAVSPGQTCKAQLVFDEPICAMAGDRYIARNAQANRTIGGGMVLDANAPDRKRRSAQRLAWLDAVAAMLAGSGLSALLAQAPYGLSENMLMRLTGRAVEPSSAEYGDLSATKGDDRADNEADMLWVASRPAATLISRSTWNALADKAVLAMEAFHLSYADEPGADSMRLKRMAAPTMPEALWLALRDQLLQQKRLARNGPWLHRPGHTDTLSDAEIALAKRVLPLIHAGAFDPPWVRDLARAKNVADDDLRQLLRKLVRQGELFQVVRDLFYHHEAVAALAALATSLGDEHGISAALFRDATGLGRKRAIQILEFFDRTGYTRRLRDLHVVRGDQTMFAPRREFSIDQPFDLRLS